MFRQIDPTSLTPQDALELGEFLVTEKIKFVEKSKQHKGALEITHHLIIDQEFNTPGFKRYYVIDPTKGGLGQGASSKARAALGYIDVDVATKAVTYTPDQEKALRVKNTKSAQVNHQNKGTKYSHAEANNDYQISKPFTHLDMQEPIEVEKNYRGFSLFSKSYSLMNRAEGQDLDQEVKEFINGANPTTAMMVKHVLLPIVVAYKVQFADKNFVHRDIKNENVRAYLGVNKSIIKFLDMDSVLPPGSKESPYGSPGFLGPELFDQSGTLTVAQARAIFALSVLSMGCLNPLLVPNSYFSNECGVQNAQELVEQAFEQLQANGCYDPDKMPFQTGPCDLFEYMEDTVDVTQEQAEIKQLLKDMTNIDPSKRPNIDTVINRLDTILAKLEIIQAKQTPTLVI